MAILWCGGEDIDFTSGSAPEIQTGAGFFRAGYGRCGLAAPASGSLTIGSPIQGGAVTSLWMTCRLAPLGGSNVTRMMVGVGRTGTTCCIAVGLSTTSGSKLALYKGTNGSTFTQVAAEAGNSYAGGIRKLDVQIINYGVTATVNVYWDGVNIISYSGDMSIEGMADIDSVFLCRTHGSDRWVASEIIVANEDTRAMSLATMAPTGDGTTNQWTGAFTDINETTNNDATAVYTDTVDQDEQYNVTDLPAGNFAVRAVKISARTSSTVGATATKIGLGVKNGANVNYDTPTAPGTAWALSERLMAQDPTTSAAWAQSDMNGLQVEFRSAA
jgi:hypothetical protein